MTSPHFLSKNLPDADFGFYGDSIRPLISRLMAFCAAFVFLSGLLASIPITIFIFAAAVLFSAASAFIGFTIALENVTFYAKNRFILTSNDPAMKSQVMVHIRDDDHSGDKLSRAMKAHPVSFESDFNYRSSPNKGAIRLLRKFIGHAVLYCLFAVPLSLLGYFAGILIQRIV